MTEMLETAFARVQQLPEEQQDALAALIIEEIEDETRWDTAFARSPEILERLAAEAEEEDRQGKTQELDPDAI